MLCWVRREDWGAGEGAEEVWKRVKSVPCSFREDMGLFAGLRGERGLQYGAGGEQHQDGLWGLRFLRTVCGGDGAGSSSVGSDLRQVREPLHEEFKLMDKVWAPRTSVPWDNIPAEA